MSIVVFDIEARPDLALWTPPENDPDAFAPIPAWVVTTLGYAVFANGPSVRFGVVQGDESAILRAFAELLAKEPQLVSWNGRGFDIPVIENRCDIYRIPLPRLYSGKFEQDYRSRYKEKHLDLMDHCANYGAARRFNQDIKARSLGLPGKHVGNGADVEAMTPSEEAAYCLDDVAQLAWIYVSWRRRCRGTDETATFAALEEAIANEPRLAPLASYLSDPVEGRAA